MWFTVVERNEKESQAPKKICVFARAEVASQIEEATCTISSDHELGDVFENADDRPINVDDFIDSRKDGGTSVERRKEEAQNEKSGSMDTKEATTKPALTTREKTNGCETEHGIEIRRITIDPRCCVVTEFQLADISDDVGTCWRELGPKLKIAAAKIQNLDDEYRCNRDKANALLLMWKRKKGNGAVAGRLADALESIGQKRIAEQLLGVNEVNPLTCETVDEGHVISLTPSLDAKLENKLVLCEDAQGNKYLVKRLNRSDKFGTSEFEERFLKTVTQDVGNTTEYLRQESFRRTSSGVQELRKQLRKVKLDSGETESSDGIKRGPGRDGTQLITNVAAKVDPPQGESLEQLLQSWEEQCSFCEGIFIALTKLLGVVAGQLMKDNSKCIQQLWEFTMELREREKKLFSRIDRECLHSQSQNLDKQYVARVEQLEKWKRAQKEQIEGLGKLLSNLLYQGSTERKQYQERVEKDQKRYNRKSEAMISTVLSPGLERRMIDISEPLLVQRMCLVETYEKYNKKRKVFLESQLL